MGLLASNYIVTQGFSQAIHTIAVLAFSIFVGTDDVATAHFSQGLNCLCLAVILGFAWLRYLPKVKAVRALPEGKTLFTATLSQTCNTVRLINTEYKHSLRWFFLAVLLSEAGVVAFFPIAITYMSDEVKMDSLETGISFLIILFGVGVGAKYSQLVATETNMNDSWKLSLLYLMAVTAIAMFVLNGVVITYIFAFLWGAGFGWHYAVQTAYFSVIMPRDQPAEMSGLFSFCSIGLTWFPPLVGTTMNENGIHLRYIGLHLLAYFFVAVVCLSLMAPWEEAMAEAHSNSKSPSTETRNDETPPSEKESESQPDNDRETLEFEVLWA